MDTFTKKIEELIEDGWNINAHEYYFKWGGGGQSGTSIGLLVYKQFQGQSGTSIGLLVYKQFHV